MFDLEMNAEYKATGPMSFSTYMQLCLSHPEHGYYMDPQNSIFGKDGDFVTSPEISQIFGEVRLLCFLLVHMQVVMNVRFPPARSSMAFEPVDCSRIAPRNSRSRTWPRTRYTHVRRSSYMVSISRMPVCDQGDSSCGNESAPEESTVGQNKGTSNNYR